MYLSNDQKGKSRFGEEDERSKQSWDESTQMNDQLENMKLQLDKANAKASSLPSRHNWF